MKKILFLLLCTVSMYGQISTGQEQEFDTGIKNNSTQTVTEPVFVTTQGTDGTYGKITLSNLQNKKAFLSTGLIKNGAITINGDPTKFNITAGIGIISNFDDPSNPTSTIINFPAFTGITPTYLTTGNITYIAINSTPAVVMQATPFTAIQRRDLIELGAVIHSNLTTINVINNLSSPTNSGTNQLHDLFDFIGALNLSGNVYSANGANLQLNKSAGIIGKRGVNFINNWKDPHRLPQVQETALSFRYRTQNGTEGTDRINLDPALYDLNNVLTAVPNNKFTIQTVVMFQTGLTRILYGQNVYDDLQTAINAVLTRSFVIEPNSKENGIIRSYVIMKNTTTSLQNVADAKILEAQKFGGVASGGVALTLANILTALNYTPEDVANKQNSLAVDGTGLKYPTVDAVNDINNSLLHKTGNESKTGNLNLTKDPILYTGSAFVAPYPTTTLGSVVWGNSGTSSFESIVTNHKYRIRQTGSVNAVEIYVANKTNLNTFKLRIYRFDGTTYNVVGESEDIAPSLVAGASTNITLASKISGIQQGDFYGYVTTQTGTWNGLRAFDAEPNSIKRRFDGGAFADFPYSLVFNISMDKPSVVLFGSSITQGYPLNNGFTQTLYTDVNFTTYWGDILAKKLNWTYQNMGQWGSTSTIGLARFQKDVVDIKPKKLIIQITLNDVLLAIPTATALANWESMLQQASIAGIQTFVYPILPFTGYTNADYQKRDAINLGVKNLCITYGATYVENIDTVFGINKVGGDAGNLWEMNPLYATDGIHLNALGNQKLADVIAESIGSLVVNNKAILNDTYTSNLFVASLKKDYLPIIDWGGKFKNSNISVIGEVINFAGTKKLEINTNRTAISAIREGIGFNYESQLSIYPNSIQSGKGFDILYQVGNLGPYLKAFSLNNVLAGFSTLKLMEDGGSVLIGSLAGIGTRTVVADASGNLSATEQFFTGSSSLNFPSTPAGQSNELSFSVSGASDGDLVILGIPSVSENANSCYTARVSSANTVAVKFNNYSALAIDPSVGTFKVKVLK